MLAVKFTGEIKAGETSEVVRALDPAAIGRIHGRRALAITAADMSSQVDELALLLAAALTKREALIRPAINPTLVGMKAVIARPESNDEVMFIAESTEPKAGLFYEKPSVSGLWDVPEEE